jgi:beta-glucosidase
MSKFYSTIHFAVLAIVIISCSDSSMNDTVPYLDASLPTGERVQDLLGRMTLEQKAAQMVQGELPNVDSADMAAYGLGSVLNGGNTNPGANRVSDWQDMINGYQEAALSRELKIPIIYGTDAVHGHSNVPGATIFPHNIGLGAANDTSLMYEMGRITGQELLLTNINWNFAPCVALANDPRWGRTYESFSTESEIVARLAEAYAKGLMSTGVVGSAKHFIGDGGTQWGSGLENQSDRGNTIITDELLRSYLLPPYIRQVELGMQTIMPSYSSINGTKMHQKADLLTGLLKEELGFKGFLISDWQAIEEIPNATLEQQVVISVNAGVDMIMQPKKWKQIVAAIVKGAQEGSIAMERIDDAVSRILKVKFDSGLFEDPSMLNNPNRAETLRSEEARKVATALVEKSLVLLKNKGSLLPLKSGTKVYVTGKGADDIGLQSGGWTISWQGGPDGDIRNTDGVSISEALSAIAEQEGVEIITDPSRANEADMVLLVLSETPYAEMHGDDPNPSILGGHGYEENQKSFDEAKRLGKPVATIILSGRHLFDLDELQSEWNAIVMAYWPGSEAGTGIANVLLGKSDFSGKLPMPWFKSVDEMSNKPEDLLYPVGYGLKY